MMMAAPPSEGARMRQRTVLWITANPQEAQQTRGAFEQVGLHPTLQVVSNHEEALAYLRREDVYPGRRQASSPDVIVLDLPLPQLNGLELLQRLKQDPQAKCLPIIVLASFLCVDDVRQVYALGANAYLRKPVECSRFAEAMGHLGRFWLESVEFPSGA
jgi:CheY-like chemotaxis protein